jgi:membrane protease YdiL (CAAX protease family)
MLHLLWQIPVIFILILLVQALVFTVTGDMPEDGGGVDAVLGEVGLGLGIVAFLGVAVLTPIWEEIVFRGVIYGGLKPRLGLLAAALISASAFAIAHGVPILLPYMFTVGLAFVFLREFHRTLWAPIALHMSINTLAFVVAVTTLRA